METILHTLFVTLGTIFICLGLLTVVNFLLVITSFMFAEEEIPKNVFRYFLTILSIFVGIGLFFILALPKFL